MDSNTKNKEIIGLRPIIVGYLRQWKLIVGTCVFSLVLAVLYLVLYPNTYKIMARIQIQEENNMMSTGSLGLGEAAGIMRSFGLGSIKSNAGVSIDDEIQTIYSNTLMSEMITQLGLYVTYTKPYKSWIKMYGEEPIKVMCDPITLANLDESIKFKITVQQTGKIQIRTKTQKESHQFLFDSFPAFIDLKQGRFVITKNPITPESFFTINAEIFPPSWVAETLKDNVSIEDYSNASNIIEFTYYDYERQRAKDILNTLVSLYNDDFYLYQKKTGDMSLQFLDGRIESVMADLSDVEKKIELFKRANQLTDVQFDIQSYAEYMKDLKGQIMELESQTYLMELMDQFVKDPKNNYSLVPSLFTTTQDTEGSPVSAYNRLLLDRERLLLTATEINPSVVEKNLQIDKMRESVFQMIDNSHQAMVMAKQNLVMYEKELLNKMGDVPEQEKIYVDYRRQQEIFQGVYLILLQKREEIALSIGQNIDRGKVIDAAYVMKKPVQPRKLYAAIGVIFLTFVLSVAWLFLKEIFLSLKEEFKRTA